MTTRTATKMMARHVQGKINDTGTRPLNVFWGKWLLITFQQHQMEYLSKEQTFYQSRIFPWEASPWEILFDASLDANTPPPLHSQKERIIRGLRWIVLEEEGEEEEIHPPQSKKDCEWKNEKYGFRNNWWPEAWLVRGFDLLVLLILSLSWTFCLQSPAHQFWCCRCPDVLHVSDVNCYNTTNSKNTLFLAPDLNHVCVMKESWT